MSLYPVQERVPLASKRWFGIVPVWVHPQGHLLKVAAPPADTVGFVALVNGSLNRGVLLETFEAVLILNNNKRTVRIIFRMSITVEQSTGEVRPRPVLQWREIAPTRLRRGRAKVVERPDEALVSNTNPWRIVVMIDMVSRFQIVQ